MGVVKTVCPECGEEFNVFDVRGRKPSIPQADLRKLREWVNERYTATNHNYFLEMSDKMNELGLWEK